MSAKLLAKAGADTPDDFCCNCRAGVFDFVPMSKMHLLAGCSRLGTYTLCQQCEMLENALIKDSGSLDHPLRIAHYERMEAR